MDNAMSGHPQRSYIFSLCGLVAIAIILVVVMVSPEPYNNTLFQLSAFVAVVILYFRSKNERNRRKTLTANFKTQTWGGRQ